VCVCVVWDYPGRPVPEETFTHSHPSWSSNILYQLPPFIRCMTSSLFNLRAWQSFSTTSLQVLFGLPPGLGPSTSETIQFFTQSSSFLNTCPYHRSLFCCNTNAMSSIPSLSHSSLLGNLSFTLMPHIYLTILMCHLIFFPYNRTKLNTTNIIAVSKNKVYV